MKNLKTRQWSTPLVIMAGVFVAVTGVLLFFHLGGAAREAHEWIGLAMAAGILFHVLNHWGTFTSYFSQKLGAGVMGGVALVAIGLVLGGALNSRPNPKGFVLDAFLSAPLAQVAGVLGKSSQELAAQLGAQGITVDGDALSIKQIARANAMEPFHLVEKLAR
ncbi:DUF4405 domain-containing protein [Magnetofaba australis]|uniref:Flavinylation-associated cytochrome domain-containing protein n=1 Tax=Magnetofaba australis IT-1 TaxID=1434232 RepID=A0A1Y2K5U4_9PROT|nr:DUF4405 domain-containing protein [Magnetofaba australis]OSM04900.1 hypothetical protein MAIT1_03008 [Magnetofaba australis IT-1]